MRSCEHIFVVRMFLLRWKPENQFYKLAQNRGRFKLLGQGIAGLYCSLRKNTMATERGALIVFEGVDRCGKTTQVNKLVNCLLEKGKAVEGMKFPERTTVIGQMINNYLCKKCDLEDHSVHLLFSANRWEAVPKMKKLLECGTTLVVDRYAFSGVAFTAAKPGFDLEWCKQPDIGLPKPDAVLYLSLPPEAAEKRGNFGCERYEKTDFQIKVSENFQKLKESNWIMIDADKSIEDLHEEIKNIVLPIIENSKMSPLEKLWTEQTKSDSNDMNN